MKKFIITRKNHKDLVLISLVEHNSLKETKYLLAGKNREILLKSSEQAKTCSR